MKSKQGRTLAGMTWYTEKEWERMKSICIDNEKLENSFKEWEAMTQKAFDDLKAQVMNFIKVYVNADDFYIYCLDHSLPLNAASRSEYVVKKMASRDKH